MNLEELKKSGRIIFECIAGSHLYNLNTPQSDFDTRGLYLNPYTEYLGLSEPSNQIGDEKHDTVYYSLKRFFELAMTANPNILELNFVPEDYMKICTPVMKKIIENIVNELKEQEPFRSDYQNLQRLRLKKPCV